MFVGHGISSNERVNGRQPFRLKHKKISYQFSLLDSLITPKAIRRRSKPKVTLPLVQELYLNQRFIKT